jgi:hypothetical protein
MTKAVNILNVLEKAHQGKNMSKKAKMQIADAYGRALIMQKIIADFLKVNRQLLIDMGISENANLLHGKEYSLHISQKIGAKIDTALVKEKLGELEYHKCKVPTQYKTIQAMAIDDKRVAIDSGRYSTRELSDFQLAV